MHTGCWFLCTLVYIVTNRMSRFWFVEGEGIIFLIIMSVPALGQPEWFPRLTMHGAVRVHPFFFLWFMLWCIWNCVASNGRMIDSLVEGIWKWSWPNECTTLWFSWRDWVKPWVPGYCHLCRKWIPSKCKCGMLVLHKVHTGTERTKCLLVCVCVCVFFFSEYVSSE